MGRDGSRVVMAGAGGWVSVVDLRKKKRTGPSLGTQPDLTSLAIDREARHAITGEQGRQIVRWDLTRGGKEEEDESVWIFGIWAGTDSAIVRGEGVWRWELSTGRRTAVRVPTQCEIASAPSAGIWAVSKWSESGRGTHPDRQVGPAARHAAYKSKRRMSSLQISRHATRLVAAVHPLGCVVLELADGRTIWQKDDLAIGGSALSFAVRPVPVVVLA